jgi:hypothetical protein
LSFGGQIQGFWAFVIASEHSSDISLLLPVIHRFAVEIGEILHRREQWNRQETSRKRLLTRLLRLEAKEQLLHQVHGIMALLEKRLGVLDRVVNSLDTAIILYDIFGQLTHVNTPMTRLLTAMKIVPFKMSALDLAVCLTDQSEAQMRDLFSQMIVNQDTLNLPVSYDLTDRVFQLTIQPLTSDEIPVIDQEAYPFGLNGILFEMVDITDIKDVETLKTLMFERGSMQLKKGVESLTNVCLMLEDGNMIEQKKQEILRDLDAKKEEILSFMSLMNEYMGTDTHSETSRIFPTNVIKTAWNAMTPYSDTAEQRRITFKWENAETDELVMATPRDLKKLLSALFALLMEDAYDDSVITVCLLSQNPEDMIPGSTAGEPGSDTVAPFSATDAEPQFPEVRRVFFQMENSGYGMPDEDLHRYLFDTTASISKPFKHIHRILPKLKYWQAELTGHGEVGKGLRFIINLKRFQ